MTDRTDAIEAYLTASRAFVGIAVRSMDASPVEVSMAGQRILVLLAAHGPQRIRDLSEALQVHASNASRHCERLRQAGLVERTRSTEDGRAASITLTRGGRAVLDAVTAARRTEIERIVDQLPTDRLDDLTEALHRFNDAAHEVPDRQWVDVVHPGVTPPPAG